MTVHTAPWIVNNLRILQIYCKIIIPRAHNTSLASLHKIYDMPVIADHLPLYIDAQFAIPEIVNSFLAQKFIYQILHSVWVLHYQDIRDNQISTIPNIFAYWIYVIPASKQISSHIVINN